MTQVSFKNHSVKMTFEDDCREAQDHSRQNDLLLLPMRAVFVSNFQFILLQMVNDVMFCYHNVTGVATQNVIVIDTACTPPTDFICEASTAEATTYGQEQEGSLYRYRIPIYP